MDPLAQSKLAEAAHAAAISKEADIDAMKAHLSTIVNDAVQAAFSASAGQGRYIDISRIPLICQSIVGIDKKLDELVTQAEFWPVKTLVYGITGLMLAAVVGALMVLVLIK